MNECQGKNVVYILTSILIRPEAFRQARIERYEK